MAAGYDDGMRYDEFLKQLKEKSGIESPEQVSTIVLEELGSRLEGQEPADLAGQLPPELKGPLTRHTGAAEKFGADEFFRRIAEREGRGGDPEIGQAHARAVLGTIAGFVSEGELEDVRSQLPAGFRELVAP
ncbi:uncharacterized protein (DUF2267 family) [Saccharopolyspora erythraea NRRL 2338]|uniref:Uncharacterized protein n=2 Tax=Saccharopolyspora erythraea TaxID=1836 RepID=A4FMR8_SACEN|nr:DUF2267 domain-containing protein [Saccharopolyspora erythraea]EQD85961.1 hypothetical protein N599_12100 [Saccharopolyspora erythraea D]PFG98988.1 uncharacterized protein (DUF2267 family) [Saccharopolyspora erythraea NRRL 2338]QRK88961.1 DUF2267 domain-containing protein [Saccharopolyspora erythraea]CAM05343.1 hypothetical protein SACE_6170 [Saccharopolyspora erythraea NRRL 2338]